MSKTKNTVTKLSFLTVLFCTAASFGQQCVASSSQTCTPNIKLALPVSQSTNWNTPLNQNFNYLDTLLSGGATLTGLSFSGGTFTGNPTFSGVVSTKNTENIRYADQFTGGDCGAKINAADTDIGTGAGIIVVNNSCGTTVTTAITISSNHTLQFVGGSGAAQTVFSFSAAPAIQLPLTGHTAGLNFTSQGSINCTPGVYLRYTGTGDLINQQITAAAEQNDNAGVITNCYIDGTGAGTSAVGIHFGGTEEFIIDGVKCQNWTGASSACIRLENATGINTNQWWLRNVAFNKNNWGIDVKGPDCAAGTPSSSNAQHHAIVSTTVNIYSSDVAWMNVRCGVEMGRGQIDVHGAATTGAQANPLVQVDTKSAFGPEIVFEDVENDTGGAWTRFKGQSSGSYGWIDVSGVFFSSGSTSDSGFVNLGGTLMPNATMSSQQLLLGNAPSSPNTINGQNLTIQPNNAQAADMVHILNSGGTNRFGVDVNGQPYINGVKFDFNNDAGKTLDFGVQRTAGVAGRMI